MKINNLFFFAILIAAMGCSKEEEEKPTPVTPTYDATITLRAGETYQVIQGFGCASAFTPPGTSAYTSAEFDRLFGSGAGQVGLHIFRIRLATDNAWRTTELNYAKEAVQRGARIIASPWSPPASMKTNGNLVGGSLKPDSSAAFARYLNDFALYMEANGAPLYAISVQNEPDYVPGYEGCGYTAEQMRDFIRDHGQTITATRLMAPECASNNQNYLNTILSDPGAVANLDIAAGHIYGGGVTENQLAKSLGKEVWMTEHLDTNITYAANINTALEIHDCLTKANFNAYIWWYGKRFYGPIGQDGLVTKRGFVLSQFARFIKPGSVRLGVGVNSRSDVFISAYQNGTKRIIVAINTGPGDVNQTISIDTGTLSAMVPYTTTELKNVEQGNPITASGNSIKVLLPHRSITTLVEQ